MAHWNPVLKEDLFGKGNDTIHMIYDCSEMIKQEHLIFIVAVLDALYFPAYQID